MKYIKSISKEANEIRVRFQKTIIDEYIRINGSLKGYKGQIYILLPKFDKRTPIYKGCSKESYFELDNYLREIQSQRRWSRYTFFNELDIVKKFAARDFNICYNRVWHNGVTFYRGKHWAAQAAVLFNGIDKYGFTFYEHDYNFRHENYNEIKNANPLLVSIYTRILDRKMAEMKVCHEN